MRWKRGLALLLVLSAGSCGPGAFKLDGSSNLSGGASSTSPGGSSSTNAYYLIALDGTNSTIAAYTISAGGALSPAATPTAAVGTYVTAVSVNSKFVFSVGGTSASSYSLNSATGKLTLVNTVTLAGANATFVSVHPGGGFIYVSDGTMAPTGHVYTLSVDPTAGTLANVSNVITGGLDYPHCVRTNAAGTFAFAADYASGAGTGSLLSAFSINAGTGALTALGGSPFSGTNPTNVADPRNLILDPTGQYLYLVDESSNPTKVSYYTISGAGALTVHGSASPGAGNSVGGGINISPDGKFIFATNRTGNTVSTYTATAGALAHTSLAATSGTQPLSIAVHPAGGFLYVSHQGSGDISAFAYSTTTGALTPLPTSNYTLPGGSVNSAFVAIAKVTTP